MWRRRTPAATGAVLPGCERVSEVLEILVNDALQVAVQLGSAGAVRKGTNPGQPGAEYLFGVVAQPSLGAPRHCRTPALKQLREADGRLTRPPFRERQRAHPHADDATSARVGAGVLRGWGPGQQEAARRRLAVDGAPDAVPHRRHVLPFVDEHRGGADEEPVKVRRGSAQDGAGRDGEAARRGGGAHALHDDVGIGKQGHGGQRPERQVG